MFNVYFLILSKKTFRNIEQSSIEIKIKRILLLIFYYSWDVFLLDAICLYLTCCKYHIYYQVLLDYGLELWVLISLFLLEMARARLNYTLYLYLREYVGIKGISKKRIK